MLPVCPECKGMIFASYHPLANCIPHPASLLYRGRWNRLFRLPKRRMSPEIPELREGRTVSADCAYLPIQPSHHPPQIRDLPQMLSLFHQNVPPNPSTAHCDLAARMEELLV